MLRTSGPHENGALGHADPLLDVCEQHARAAPVRHARRLGGVGGPRGELEGERSELRRLPAHLRRGEYAASERTVPPTR